MTWFKLTCSTAEATLAMLGNMLNRLGSSLLIHTHFARRHLRLRICLTRNTMAVAPEIDRRFRPKEQNETNPPAAGPDNVDNLVFDFLQELKGLSTEINPVKTSKVEAEKPAEILPVFETDKAPGIAPLEPVAFREEVVSEPELDAAVIDKEIDATLAEIERRKSTVIPINDRKDANPEPASTPAKSPKQPVAASTPPAAKAAATPTIRKAEEPEWNRLEIFRTEIETSRLLSKQRKTFCFTLAAILLLGVLIFFLFLK